MKTLIVIVGPTAVGKTAAGIALAEHFNCEIVSCDSRQFFKEMNIGTAVPSKDELEAAQHHMIGHKSVTEQYTVGEFEKEAIEVLDRSFKHNNYAILVGGSGLYASAILKGIDVFPEVDVETKEYVQLKYGDEGISWLQNQLLRKDQSYYAKVDVNNPQRLMRAVEVCISSGRPYSEFLGRNNVIRNFTPIVIGLEAEREVLYARINARVDQMMQDGLLEEARRLLPFRNLNALQTVGYRELFEYFDGIVPLAVAIDQIKQNTRRFAKRQMTWFRKMENVEWFDYRTDPAQIISYIESRRF